ncbi:ABC transporter permease [Spiroplasma endosymbiont of Othius punctulatus]|uniref:ABC transporter permease n=1 Tax=Spiroplasma endosymbiont of Othius punctulatus TaxID=3066289 RepID=UPI0030D13E3C
MKSFNILFKMQWDHYRKDIVTITYGWAITFITLIVWLTFKQTDPGLFNYDPFVLASAIGVGTVRNCTHGVTRVLFNFKNQGFMSRVYMTPVSKRNFIMSIILFNTLVNFVISVALFSFGMIYLDQRSILGNVNWPMFLLGYLMLVVTSLLISFLIVEFVKSQDKASFWGNIFFYVCVWFLGLGVPYTELSQYEFFTYITYLFPQKYALNIMQSGWIGSTNFQIQEGANFGYSGHEFLPYLLGSLMIVILSCTLIFIYSKKYHSTKYTSSNNSTIQQSYERINQIKNARNIGELEGLMSSKSPPDEGGG